jgi:tRNA threonylcarbamoyladenosine biosynthesis protein TsaB
MSQFALAIETSTPVGSVAIGSAASVLAEIVLGANSRHSEQLLPAIDYGLRIAAVPREQLSQVIIGSGPGSFTGLRIAAATAKGLAAALGIEILGFSGLLATAVASGIRDQEIAVLFDARRREVYGAIYAIGDATIDTIVSPVVESLDGFLARGSHAGRVFTGEGAVKHADEIRRNGASVLPAHLGIPRASALLWLANEFAELGRIDDVPHWEPNYLRASGAERGVRG